MSLHRSNGFFLLVGVFLGFPLLGVAMLIALVVSKQTLKSHDYETKLKPSIGFVYAFQKAKHRLPSEQEFVARPNAKTDWMVDLVTKSSGDAAFKSEGGRTLRDFCVRIWRGEQWTYYFSWKKSFDVVEP